MQIFILHYYRAIPLIRCLRIYTKNDNNMATVGFYLDTRREKKDGTFPVKLQVRHKGQIMLCTDFALHRKRGRAQSIIRTQRIIKLRT